MLELGDDVSAAVIGAPGSGKTTTAVELVADRVLGRGWDAGQLLMLTTGRVTATLLRDQLALRLRQPTTGPLARTINSLAFDVVSHTARRAGRRPPRLITGGEQDSDLAQLLAGHEEDGAGPAWPEHLGPEVRRLRGFRTELRELMMRSTEYGVSPARLRALGHELQRPEWEAAADFITEYRNVLGIARPDQYDSAELARLAEHTIRSDDPGELVSRLRLVIVDDFQEATESALALLRALSARGVAVIAFGDPDVAANAFRGGEPDALGRFASALQLPSARTLILNTVHRHDHTLRRFTGRIVERIGTAAAGAQRAATAPDGAAQADATQTDAMQSGTGSTQLDATQLTVAAEDAAGLPDDTDAPIVILHALSPARQWSAIARLLRERNLRDGVTWNEMAVVVRSGAQVPAIARALAVAEVPTRTSVGSRALRDDHAARALLTVVDVGMGRSALTPETASAMLLGPFGGLDRLTLRRLRLALRAEELAAGGHRSSDDLLVEALAAPGRFATIDHRVGRQAERLAAILHQVRGLAASGGTIEELLWLVWERSGVGEAWYTESQSAGISAAEANRNLDGVLALFSAAKRFVEREPTSPAANFLEAVLDSEVPEDTLAPQARGDAVLITTASGVVGLEFEVVAVAALQEGIWPNLRIRGSLLGPQELVRAVTGLHASDIDERKQVRDDELRMFALAVSRARRQVILSAVVTDDEAPSVLFSLVPGDVPVTDAARLGPLSLRGLTGRLRRELVARQTVAVDDASPARAPAADANETAAALAVLASAGVPGANPADWHGLIAPSTVEPLFGDDELVPVSPSRLESFEDSAIDWFIDTVAGGKSSTAQGLGTIIHWAMEHATDTSIDTVWEAIESRWSELLFEAPWVGEQQKTAARAMAAAVAEYLADFERDGKQLVAREGRFELDIDAGPVMAQMRGSIDRVEQAADGSVVIVDLKTGRPITKADKIRSHPQLGAYQLAYAEGKLDEFLNGLDEHQSGGAKLLFVKEGVNGKPYREAVQPPLDEEELEGFRNRIRQAAIGMAAASFSGVLDLEAYGVFNAAARMLHRVRAVSSD